MNRFFSLGLIFVSFTLLIGAACSSRASATAFPSSPSPSAVSSPTLSATATQPATSTPQPTISAPESTIQSPQAFYDIGDPTLTDLWIDPVNGDDSHTGASRTEALATLTEAYNRIPMGTPLATGYRILLFAGIYAEDIVPHYWESRYGSYQFPVILESADGAGAAVLPVLNIYDVKYMYLIGVQVSGISNNVLHCEQCTYFLLRQVTIVGADPETYLVQETLKMNQSQYVYVEESDISGAWNPALDFVSVQYGHILNNRVHNAGDWCMYLKGGSAYFRIEGNEFYGCGTGGFTAGQGTGFEFMVSPWLHYETYDIKFVNNVLHDIDGACLGVNGSYNILFAFNTCYRVGARSHVIEVAFGARSCDGDAAQCAARQNEGGWGPSTIGGDGEPIPDRNVYIYNNVIYNPAGFQSQWQHFVIYGPRTPTPGTNIPSPATTDFNLQIRGNLIWNGPADHPLGVGDESSGCQNDNPTCNVAQLLAENTINQLEPQLIDPANGNFRPLEGGNLFSVLTFALPDFNWDDAPTPPAIPMGDLNNAVVVDRDGQPRSTPGVPGAYGGAPAAMLFLPSVMSTGYFHPIEIGQIIQA